MAKRWEESQKYMLSQIPFIFWIENSNGQRMDAGGEGKNVDDSHMMGISDLDEGD